MRLKLLLLAIVCLHYFPVLYGQTVWTGSQDSLWNNPNNWSTNQVPTSATAVRIPNLCLPENSTTQCYQ